MTEELFSQAYASCLALGFGGLGGRAAAGGAESGFGPGLLWAAAGTRAAELIATGLEHKLLLGQTAGEEDGKGGPAPTSAAVRRRLKERREELEALVAGHSAALLFGALAGADARLTAPPLCELLRECGVRTFVLGREPFAFEGAAAGRAAAAAATRIAAAADFFCRMPAAMEPSVENAAAGTTAGAADTRAARAAEQPFSAAFTAGEGALTAAAEILAALLAAGESAASGLYAAGICGEDAVFSPAVLKRLTSGTKLPLLSFGRAGGRDAATTALAQALSSAGSVLAEPLPGAATKEKKVGKRKGGRAGESPKATFVPAAVIAASGRELTAGEVESLRQPDADGNRPPLWIPPPDEAWEPDEIYCLVLHAPPAASRVVSLA